MTRESATDVSYGLGFRVEGWIHFTLFGIILPTIKLKVYTFWGLMNSAIKVLSPYDSGFEFKLGI